VGREDHNGSKIGKRVNARRMAGHLFFVALCQHGALLGIARQAVEAVAQQYVTNPTA
jgi:hypothetical protein